MNQESGNCSDTNCGCHVDIFPTDEKCPRCDGRLRLAGRAQLLEFRLACSKCDYRSTLLSREELHKVV